MYTQEMLEMAIEEVRSQLQWVNPKGRGLEHVVLPREVAELMVERCEESLQRVKPK